MSKNYYKSGEFNLICDSCGKKIKASEAHHRWDGFIVCKADMEQRHPQDFVRAKSDKITIPFSRPRPPDVFKLTEGLYEETTIIDSLTTALVAAISLSDVVTVLETILITKSKEIIDFITTLDSLQFSYAPSKIDALDIQEFLAFTRTTTFTDVTTMVETIVLVITQALTRTDTVSITSSGSITIPAYAIDYFAEDYTQSTQTFS